MEGTLEENSILTNDVTGLIYNKFNITRPFQPVALSMLLAYWEPGSTMTYDQAVYCATAVIMMSLLIAFVNHHGTYSTQQFGMKVRIAACSLIYRKVCLYITITFISN